MPLVKFLISAVLILAGAKFAVAQQSPPPARIAPQASQYAIGGLALGGRVRFDSAAYRDYQCDPSDQFDGFTWCQKTSRERERRGSFDVSYTILHSRDGSAVYINRNQAPAFWDPNEVNEDIDRYSRKIGERPRIISMPRRQGLPNGIIAHWGNVVLEPLDSDSLKVLAEGKSSKKGILFDFVGNLARSAREGLPVYRVSGGAGFVWVASYDQNGGGTLRFSAVDASAFMPQVARTPVPTPSIPASLYVVDGFALGGRVPLDSAAYRDYQCDPSEQFDGFTWCKRESSARGKVTSSNSILHSQDGTAVYVNRAVVPAYFDRNEFDRDIQNLSNRFGEKARTLKLSQRRGLPDAVVAFWGKVNLQPLDPDSISILASGGNVKKGFLIDFLGDWERSARQGLPIYRLVGGAGYVWAASRDNEGRGHVRFLAIDASALMPQVARAPVPTPSIPGTDGKAPAPQRPPEPAIYSGTGFFVGTEGHIITNAHVVADCRSVSSSRGGQISRLAIDKESDLALYIASEKPRFSARIRGGRGARVGEFVVAIGFPLSGLLSSDPIVTTGTISALAGLKNDRREIQITAPVQPGNSGGPLIGETGSVVGVIVGKLDAVKVARAIGDIPQNVNFAVSLGTLQSFLNANAVPYIIDEGTVAQTPADIAAEASRYTVLLECLQ